MPATETPIAEGFRRIPVNRRRSGGQIARFVISADATVSNTSREALPNRRTLCQ
jgi:hypothetical protein